MVHADVSGKEFDAERVRLGLGRRLGLEVAAAATGVYLRFAASRDGIGKHLGHDDLPTREEAAALRPVKRPLIDVRDERLCQKMRAVLEEPSDKPRSVAVIYGSAHMPGLVRFLRDFGDYQVIDSRWMTVFRY